MFPEFKIGDMLMASMPDGPIDIVRVIERLTYTFIGKSVTDNSYREYANTSVSSNLSEKYHDV